MPADPTPPPTPQSDIVRGTLDLLILKAVSLEAMHGWAIAQRIEQLSRDALHVGQGSLYPALQRLEEKGWIESEWRTAERSEEHTSELQSRLHLVCRLLLEKKKTTLHNSIRPHTNH